MATQDITVDATYDITVKRGDSFNLTITVTDTDTGNAIDVSGYTFKCQVRASKNSSKKLLEFLTSDNTLSVGGASNNVITLTQTAATMAGLPDGTHYWDLEVTSGSTTETWYSGNFAVEKDVSR